VSQHSRDVDHPAKPGADAGHALCTNICRNATRQALATEKSVSATVSIFLPPDYTSWTAKGCFAPKMAREIQAERWGKSVREPRPPPASMPAEIFDPQVRSHCVPVCQWGF
jgi:hypothetical protein